MAALDNESSKLPSALGAPFENWQTGALRSLSHFLSSTSAIYLRGPAFVADTVLVFCYSKQSQQDLQSTSHEASVIQYDMAHVAALPSMQTAQW